ncbi:MAG: ABC transporter substrate-binding protein [Planctomycetes bacterium]|nr:ABC transporter substrate-binding protein [Planctomycetota bacterium]
MSRRPLLLVLLIAVLAASGAALAAWLAGDSAPPPVNAPAPRIVSLIPPITETLFEIGAGEYVVGRSDYCREPAPVRDLPACGTTLHPNVEAIARLQPTLIVCENSVNAARDKMNGLAQTAYLPWLSREDVLASTRELGRLTGREKEANAIADEIAAALPQAAPTTGPRVLLALPHQPGQMDSVWFLRRNSLHGATLHAAGARNVVAEDITGTPQLSLERVIELDPDMIIVLHSSETLTETDRNQMLADWRKLTTLRAAREGRVVVLNGAHLYPAGRGILRLIETLRTEVKRMSP